MQAVFALAGGTGHDQKANKELLLSHSAIFPTPFLRMLEKVPSENIGLWDLLDMELLPSFIKGKAVLIGDAAHPFLPCELLSYRLMPLIWWLSP